MTAERFSNALGDIAEGYIAEALTYTARKKRAVWLRWGAVAACLCLTVGTIFGVGLLIRDDVGNTGGTITDSVLPMDIDRIIWSDYIGVDAGVEEDREWNGFAVSASLYDVLCHCSSEQCIAIVVARKDGREITRAEQADILDDMINRDHKDGKLYIFVTKNELLDWEIENKDEYLFYLGDRSDYEGESK